jgi:hypothetical protein
MLENGDRISSTVRNCNPYFSNMRHAPLYALSENGRFLPGCRVSACGGLGSRVDIHAFLYPALSVCAEFAEGHLRAKYRDYHLAVAGAK